MFADSTNSVLFFNGISALKEKPDKVGKSSIYKLSAFINVPAETISEITTTDTSLSLFNEALNRTSFLERLSDGPFTLFMPVNSAFKSAGFKDITSIDKADINQLKQILIYQTIPNNIFENDLKKQTSLLTLQGKSMVIYSTSPIRIACNSNPQNSACLLNKGVIAQNIVTYKTSNLLLP